MSKVYLICTRHKELGECNVENLLDIFRRIKPDVFFEELDEDLFNHFYLNDEDHKLESDAVKRYRKEHPIMQVPVDVFPWRDNRFIDRYSNMLYRIESQSSRDAYDYRYIFDCDLRFTETIGFPYLNSNERDQMSDEINRLRRAILEQMNDPDLEDIDRRMTEIYRQRELTMMRTIYDHAATLPFKTGVFYVGSAHRRSILQLIEQFDRQGETKIRWVTTLD